MREKDIEIGKVYAARSRTTSPDKVLVVFKDSGARGERGNIGTVMLRPCYVRASDPDFKADVVDILAKIAAGTEAKALVTDYLWADHEAALARKRGHIVAQRDEWGRKHEALNSLVARARGAGIDVDLYSDEITISAEALAAVLDRLQKAR